MFSAVVINVLRLQQLDFSYSNSSSSGRGSGHSSPATKSSLASLETCSASPTNDELLSSVTGIGGPSLLRSGGPDALSQAFTVSSLLAASCSSGKEDRIYFDKEAT